jgi:hypothetical protein
VANAREYDHSFLGYFRNAALEQLIRDLSGAIRFREAPGLRQLRKLDAC